MIPKMYQPGEKIVNKVDNKSYTLVKILGVGASGQVYEAQDEKYNRVALKVQAFMFPTEIDTNTILKGKPFKHIVDTLDFFKLHPQQFNSPYIVIMEYADRGCLHSYMMEQPQLPQEEIDTIFQHLIYGISELQTLDICHRDIKPENIVIFQKGERRTYKICDLGLSKQIDQSNPLQTRMIGTPFYMAPELFDNNGNQDYDSSVDTWAAATFLYELYTQRPLFNGVTLQQVSHKILNSHLPLNKQRIEKEIETNVKNPKHIEIIKGVLQRDPTQRMKIQKIQEIVGVRLDKIEITELSKISTSIKIQKQQTEKREENLNNYSPQATQVIESQIQLQQVNEPGNPQNAIKVTYSPTKQTESILKSKQAPQVTDSELRNTHLFKPNKDLKNYHEFQSERNNFAFQSGQQFGNQQIVQNQMEGHIYRPQMQTINHQGKFSLDLIFVEGSDVYTHINGMLPSDIAQTKNEEIVKIAMERFKQNFKVQMT